MTQLLEQRGIEDGEGFLHPDFTRDVHSAALLPDALLAAERIVLAKEKGERIVVFGDYDADGIPATACMLRVLRHLGFKDVHGVIPKRSDGYGLTEGSVAKILALKPGLVITLDNGTVSPKEVAELNAAGCEVIIIDHHEPDAERVPAAFALVNPKREGSEYPFKELCAAALTWKVCWLVAEKLGVDTAFLKWELDLVALATIADMVPLVGENRALAHFGMLVMRKSHNRGLQALAQAAGVSLATLSAGQVGFQLGPRINAPSRMHSEEVNGRNIPLAVLVAEEGDEVLLGWAQYMSQHNQARQSLLDLTVQEALLQVEVGQTERHALVVYAPHWSSGVIGLVASRLLEKYARPVVVLAKEGDEIKGSVRSVDSIHAVSLMASGASYLARYGGHTKAGGLTLSGEAAVEEFQTTLWEWSAEQGVSLEELQASSRKKADMPLELGEIDLVLAKELELLEPFGIGFPGPVFEVSGMVRKLRTMGATGQHLGGVLEDFSGASKKFVAFNTSQPDLEDGDTVKVLAQVSAEVWQGSEYVQLRVVRFV